MGVARLAFCLAFALGITLATQSAALADRRIALVIGNGKYENAGVLANPTNDADAVADLFTKAGFDSVDRRRDLGVVEFKRAVREFVDRAASADVAVVYYSGHGLEIGGVNYLIPVDAKLSSVLDMDDEAVSLDRILVAAGHVKKLSLIILDACRENPFHPAADDARVTRGGVSLGLAGVGQTVADTLIAFAAKAGSVSYDGDGRNSPFTTALVKYITQPGLDIRLALGKVRDDVLRATNHRQEPYVYGSLGGDSVALVPAPPSVGAAPSAAVSPAAAPPANADADEASDYRTTERFASLDGWRAFLAIHPDGVYARLARGEVDKLLARQKTEAAKTEVAPLVTARTEVAPPLSPEALCERDADRLVRLRANPTNDEASSFASELSCEKLRPQLSRLMESLGFAMPVPAQGPPASQAVAERKPVTDCASEQAALDRLRADPSIDEAQAFWRGLQCERLRPQARMLMESLDIVVEEPSPHPVQGVASTSLPRKANDVRAVVAPGDSVAADPSACDREKQELDRLRANPDRREAERFARAMTCPALKPQAARLLDSLND
jgi:Caspase domain